MRLPVTSYDLRSRPASSSELVNCYVEALPQDARAPYLIKRSPGTKKQTTSSTFGQMWAMANHPDPGVPYVFVTSQNSQPDVAGTWYPIDESATGLFASRSGTTEITLGENLDIAANHDSLLLVSEPDAYEIVDSGTNGIPQLNQVVDADYTSRGGGDVEFLDNFLLFREPNTARFFSADLASSSAFTSTNFATAEENPDKLVGMKSDSGQLLLFGEDSVEVWDTTGGSGFPFRATINGAINEGCINGRSVALVNGQVYWMARDFTVRRLDGLTPTTVSNPAIDKALQDDLSARSATVRAFEYHWDGHSFYVLRTKNNCFSLDTTTGLWHRRKSLGHNTWRFASTAKAFNKTILGDVLGTEAGAGVSYFAGYLDAETYDEVGEVQPMSWTYQPVWGQAQRVFHERLEIVLETGVGIEDSSTDGLDPVVTLEYSDDQGDSWLPCAERTMGAYGAKFQRVVWHNLGAAYQRIYRAGVSAAVPITVTDTLLKAKGGSV